MGRYGLHDWPAPAAAPQGRTLGYRNRARMIIEGGRLGLYSAGSRDVVPIDACLVHEAAVEAVLEHVRTSGVMAFAHNVDVRANADGAAIASFGVAESPSNAQLEVLRELAGPKLSVHVNVGKSAAFLSGEHVVVEGAETLEIEVSGKVFSVPPQAFFQVNTEVLERIHDVVRPFVAGGETLWDLYCGVGVHGLACAADGQTVRGFDIDVAGVAAAQKNAERLGINAEFVAVSDADFNALDVSGNAIINPARAGLSPGLPAQLTGLDRIAYVSCEPATFLRDAERLANEGFALRELHAFDMMPRTSHIELVGLFDTAGLEKRWHVLERGITGAEGDGEQTWVALIDGTVPRKATLPGGIIKLERLRNLDGAAVVRLQSPQTDVSTLMATLKRWKHPVIGDPQGNRAANNRWWQTTHLDVPALHLSRAGENTAPTPDFLLGIFRLPRKIVGS